ncbi:MAG TPA: tetratricopeptide repeat protein, partial [Bacteroidia bacterium]|nr:tetratricopeptide repeat protein [Bacteroidia bacterium]
NGFLPWEYYASVIVIGLIIYSLWRARNNRMVLFCSGFFLVTIAINIQLIPSRLFVVSERYAYMPYLGLFLLISMMVIELKSKNLIMFNRYFPMLLVVFSVFVLFSSFTVVQRNKIWNNDLVFLTDVIEKNPPVGYIYRAYGNRGLAYKSAGKYAEAAQDFTESIKLDPTDARNYFNRGLTYEAMKNYSAALNDFTKAIELEPDKSMLYNSRSQVRFNLNDIDGAEADCKKCLELDPVNIDALNTLANITFNRNQFEACEQYLTKAIQIKPDFAVALKNRGLLYLKLNRSTDACSDFVTASNYGSEEAKQLKGQYCK